MEKRDWIDEYIDEQELHEKRSRLINAIGFAVVFVIALLLTGTPA